MKKLGLLLLTFILFANVSEAKFSKVELLFDQEEVNVLIDNKFIRINPKYIKIDFNITERIVFYKNGYYSQIVELEDGVVFNKLKINLIKKEKSLRKENKVLMKNEKIVVSSPITNFTKEDINEIINQNFIKNNYYVGLEKTIFTDAEGEIDKHKFKLGIEVVSSEQISSIYDYPRFMLASCKIRWTLLNTVTNEVILVKDTEGTHFVKFQTSKGIMASKKLKSIMETAIKESQNKFIRDSEFQKAISE